jgi:hypothetical protein
MSQYSIPLAKQDLLHHMLQVGGAAVVHLRSPERLIEATFTVERGIERTVTDVQMGEHRGSIALPTKNHANHLLLRDFIEDMANGRHESAAPRAPSAPPSEAPGIITLGNEDIERLQAICHSGGTAHLQFGVSTTVHKGLHDKSHHALITVAGNTSWLREHSPSRLLAHVTRTINEQLTEERSQ